MIASHDSYTYLTPRNLLMLLISPWWRCQKVDIEKQYKLGVRVFDVRVHRYKNKWHTAHGLAHFKKVSFNTLMDICKYFNDTFENSVIRIYLEDDCNKKKNKEIEDIFLQEADEAFSIYENTLWEIGTHHPWKTYYRNKKFTPQIKEYYCHFLNWNTDQSIKENLKHLDWSQWSLPYYAKKHNPEITEEMIYDPNVMYIIDYIGIYP